MKKILDGKRYDTDTAKRISSWDNGHYGNDFRAEREELYVTSKGTHFLYGEGGALTKYAEPVGDMKAAGEDIFPLTKEEAFEWCQNHDRIKCIETYFSDIVSEA